MSLRQLCSILLFASTTVACGQSPVDLAEKDELYMVEKQDQGMTDAFRLARSGLDGFLATWRDPPANVSEFAVKVGVTQGENTEYFWISPFRESAGRFVGEINNDPQMVTTVKFGEEITFSKDQIVDWVYQNQGSMVGNYTACAMLRKEPESERLAFEQRFGLRCAL